MVYLQLLNLSDAELEIFCRHMGHNKNIHLEHYRQMSALIERVHITKMFIIQDLNLTNKYKNQSLKDIDIKGEISLSRLIHLIGCRYLSPMVCSQQ